MAADSETIPTTPKRLAGVAWVVGVFVLVVLLIAVRGAPNERVAADQDLFHLPVIRQFAAQWPRPDLRHYASATAPGYHLLLAVVSRYGSDDVRTLRVAGAAFGVAFVGMLAWATSRRSAGLALPVAASVYVLSSTVWLLPENAAWALATLALLLALRAEGVLLFAGSAATLAALVFVRQTHVWALATVVAAAYSLSRCPETGLRTKTAEPRVGPLAEEAAGVATKTRDAEHGLPAFPPDERANGLTARFLVLAGIAVLPATLILLWLVRLWHGLTPPAFQPGSAVDLPLATRAGGFAPGAPAMTLALLGLFGTPLLAWFWPAGDRKKIVRLAATAAAIGLFLGLLPRSEYDANHRSGLWNLVRYLPTFAGRSPLFVGLSALGGGVAAVVLARLPDRPRLVLATALVGFTATQAANPSLWQRYYEPFVLLWLALAASEVVFPRATGRRWRAAGLVALVVIQLAATVYTLGRGG